jgi:hypothetical protein
MRLFLQVLRSLIGEKTDWYLDELMNEMKRRTRKHVSVPTLWRSLQYCGITRKKVFVIICNILLFIYLFVYLLDTLLAHKSGQGTQ